MPITFGSVGDIISVSLLVKDLVLALDKSRGASAAYKEVVRELVILDSTLLEVEKLSRKCGANTPPEVLALYNTAQHTIDKCRIAVDTFKKRIEKYDKSLGASGTGNIFKDVARKVQWQIGEQEVQRFRTEVMGHSSSLNMLLSTIGIATSDLNHDAAQKQAADHASAMEQSLAGQDQALTRIEGQLDENKQMLQSFKISERFDWLKKMGSELKNVMICVVKGNVAIFKELVAIRKMVMKLGRTPSEDPITLFDPFGREMPVPLKLITSWDMFQVVMEKRFENTKGYKKIRTQQYALEDRETGKDIDRSEDIDLAIFPGQTVDMSLVFRRRIKDASHDPSICPTCRKEHNKPLDMSIACDRCGRRFRRIEELFDDAELTEEHPKPKAEEVLFGTPSLPKKMRPMSRPSENAKAEGEDNGEDFTVFRNVRLIVPQQRKRQPFARSSGPNVEGSSWGLGWLSLGSNPSQPAWQTSRNTSSKGSGSTAAGSIWSFVDPQASPELQRDAAVPGDTDAGLFSKASPGKALDANDNVGNAISTESTMPDDEAMRDVDSTSFQDAKVGGAEKDVEVQDAEMKTKTESSSQPTSKATPASRFGPATPERPYLYAWESGSGTSRSTKPGTFSYSRPTSHTAPYFSNRSQTRFTTSGRPSPSPRGPREPTRYMDGSYASYNPYGPRRANVASTPRRNANVYQEYTYDNDYVPYDRSPYYASYEYTPYQSTNPEKPSQMGPRRAHQRTPQRPQPARPQTRRAQPAEKPRQATEEDAKRAGIPPGYSIKNWDPTEEPITLLGSVFDANSLGKWIYDWTVFAHGASTPLSDTAGDLWLLLIQLAGKVKRADEVLPAIQKQEDRDMIEDFIDSGERLWVRFKKLLKVCEEYMWRAAKEEAGGERPKKLGKNSGVEFINSLLGRDRELEKTEKMMASIRLWSMRFDANCEDILRNAGNRSSSDRATSATVAPQASNEDKAETSKEPNAALESRWTSTELADGSVLIGYKEDEKVSQDSQTQESASSVAAECGSLAADDENTRDNDDATDNDATKEEQALNLKRKASFTWPPEELEAEPKRLRIETINEPTAEVKSGAEDLLEAVRQKDANAEFTEAFSSAMKALAKEVTRKRPLQLEDSDEPGVFKRPRESEMEPSNLEKEGVL